MTPVGRSFDVAWEFSLSDPACFVYKVIGVGGGTTYVGITNSFAGRWTSHRRTSSWANTADIKKVILMGYGSRREARMVEARWIDKYRPTANTKPERKYLRIVREEGVPVPRMAAELVPRRVPQWTL